MDSYSIQQDPRTDSIQRILQEKNQYSMDPMNLLNP